MTKQEMREKKAIMVALLDNKEITIHSDTYLFENGAIIKESGGKRTEYRGKRKFSILSTILKKHRREAARGLKLPKKTNEIELFDLEHQFSAISI